LNRVRVRIGVLATTAALVALLLSTAGPASAAKPFGKKGVIHACIKAKGKNRGALRVVAAKRACKRMRGWRALSWSAKGQPGRDAQANGGQPGPQGSPGPEGKPGQPGAAGQIEQSLLETIQTQSAQINALTEQVTDLSGKVLSLEGGLSTVTGDLVNLEGTVGEACGQLSVLTDQTDEILSSLLGSTVAVLGNLLDVPSPPAPLGAFECG
jgi:hypothetical protein